MLQHGFGHAKVFEALGKIRHAHINSEGMAPYEFLYEM